MSFFFLTFPILQCAKCHEFVTDDKVVVARGAKYHSRCFVCSDPSCGRPFEGSSSCFCACSFLPSCAFRFVLHAQ